MIPVHHQFELQKNSAISNLLLVLLIDVLFILIIMAIFKLVDLAILGPSAILTAFLSVRYCPENFFV